MNSIDIEQHINNLLNLSKSLSGHLRKRKVQFLAYLPFIRFVCFHDLLHGFEGPLGLEKALLSDLYGDCGFCGSIGWGQFLGKTSVSSKQWKNKLSLYSKLSRMVPFVLQKNWVKKQRASLQVFSKSYPIWCNLTWPMAKREKFFSDVNIPA